MGYCMVSNCLNRKDRRSFKFPRHKYRQILWIEAIGSLGPKEWHSNKDYRICQDHFKPSDFEGKGHRLKRQAVPSIFNDSKIYLKKVLAPQKQQIIQGSPLDHATVASSRPSPECSLATRNTEVNFSQTSRGNLYEVTESKSLRTWDSKSLYELHGIESKSSSDPDQVSDGVPVELLAQTPLLDSLL